jgi:hypothetical protein
MVASDGGIFKFGDAVFKGSMGGTRLNQPIVGMAATRSGKGYWMVARDGGIFNFGDASFRGSTGGIRLNRPIVGMAAGPSTSPYRPGSRGFDISWPQCPDNFPTGPKSFAIIGTTRGSSFTANPCFEAEWDWAGPNAAAYIVLQAPEGGRGDTGPLGTCAPTDTFCKSYNYGWKAARHSVGVVNGADASPVFWWLDVETAKPWSSDQAANARVVQGAVDSLKALGFGVGIYSTSFQWGVITGGYTLGLPIWVAGASAADPARHCEADKRFAGGEAWLAQYVKDNFDNNFACP